MEGFKGNAYAFGELWGRGRETRGHSSLGLPNPPIWKLQVSPTSSLPASTPPRPLLRLALSTSVQPCYDGSEAPCGSSVPASHPRPPASSCGGSCPAASHPGLEFNVLDSASLEVNSWTSRSPKMILPQLPHQSP